VFVELKVTLVLPCEAVAVMSGATEVLAERLAV
jgi:hypothetical protein